MGITPYTFMMALLWSSLFSILLLALRRQRKYWMVWGLLPLVILMGCSLLRHVFALEFPFTVVVPSRTILPAVIRSIEAPVFTLEGQAPVRVYQVGIALWIAGSLYRIKQYLEQWWIFRSLLATFSSVEEESVTRILKEVQEEAKGRRGRNGRKAKILRSHKITIPLITGVRKPVICLPAMDFTDEELKHILRHEWSHFVHRDLWKKILVHLTYILFWWNPLLYLLEQETNQLIELECDCRVTAAMEEHQREEYLGVLIQVAKTAKRQKHGHILFLAGNAFTQHEDVEDEALEETMAWQEVRDREKIKTAIRGLTGFSFINKWWKPWKSKVIGQGESGLEQRFYFILERSSYKHRPILSALLCTGIILFTAATYGFVIQPYGDPPTHDENGEIFSVDLKDASLIQYGLEQYALYTEGKYQFDITRAKEGPFSILPIFKEEVVRLLLKESKWDEY